MVLLRRFANWLRPKLPVLNIMLALAAGLANNYLIQGFCQPVPWVWWVLGPTLAAFLVWPWLKQVPRLNYLLLFLQGMLLPICLYCTLFAGPYLVMTLLFGFLVFPLLMWTPVVFLGQVVRRAWISLLPKSRWVFAAGTLPLLLAQGWAWGQYRQVLAAVAALPPAQRHQAEPLLRVVPRTYMAERLAGQLFKYHALPEMIYDGWRPPLHDPLVNVCMTVDFIAHFGHPEAAHTGPLIIGQWNQNYGGYWQSDINTQADFYHKLFPNEPVKAACACAHIGDAEGYYTWKPGLTDNRGTPLAEVERQEKEFDAEMARMRAQLAADSAHAASR